MSFADNWWVDLHRLFPENNPPPKDPNDLIDKLNATNAIKNAHLSDYYFSTKLDLFIEYFFKKIMDIDWFWYRLEWQSRTAFMPMEHADLKMTPDCATWQKLRTLDI